MVAGVSNEGSLVILQHSIKVQLQHAPLQQHPTKESSQPWLLMRFGGFVLQLTLNKPHRLIQFNTTLHRQNDENAKSGKHRKTDQSILLSRCKGVTAVRDASGVSTTSSARNGTAGPATDTICSLPSNNWTSSTRMTITTISQIHIPPAFPSKQGTGVVRISVSMLPLPSDAPNAGAAPWGTSVAAATS